MRELVMSLIATAAKAVEGPVMFVILAANSGTFFKEVLLLPINAVLGFMKHMAHGMVGTLPQQEEES